MKKRNLIIIIGLILTAGLIFYLLKPEFLKSPAKSKPQASAQTAAPAHQEHTAESKEPQAQVETQQKEQTEEAPAVEIPLEKQQLLGVKTVAASVKPLQKIIRTVGRIEYDERRLATVNTKIEGWIERLYVNYTGKYVKKGEPLAEIYSPELVATQQEFLNLLKWKQSAISNQQSAIEVMLSKDAEAIIEAAKQRLRLWDINDAQIKKIEEAGKPIRTLTIYSPASGYVVQKTALQGIRVMPGERLFDVADLSRVWIVSDIYEYDVSLIKIGQTAKISLSYFPGREFSSRIDYIYPSLAGESRTAKIRFTIANPGGQLKPQMFTNVEVKINLGNKLSVPESAVIDTGIRQIVYVDKGEGYFEPREVMIGLKAEGMVEVLKGIKAGEKVASSGNFLIDSEAQLKGIKPLGHKH
ncbi:MAG: efflux RND transporter periplasmic adaptor subunit [Nitrospirae bacterium CG_4_10_14_3_um_filter_44_29]|nr:efflux RND transporter periplasmic adaptor subunit [Nitrospirota bacterium]PIP69601.1 MAG: efflux transporter periplasmic adaptor subunit [Nitrospirae bacterium CG22_combo_CG10-13_8_21_14_all_44_11]PIV40580.1 MAG: efflux RND transporter periplasmic adaptor subunit [Nitrospirae bacterium CG02_land_8_20_14_3_00_44_33]PIV67109.1 MAG: efflux RND transporter periplasmic adaptor subunit [Nitrospirae bacterium CG01_land_8_20_14_3_00_44_22]PIW88540.1 MAG: efflux RND transporter periplasmic adaptor s